MKSWAHDPEHTVEFFRRLDHILRSSPFHVPSDIEDEEHLPWTQHAILDIFHRYPDWKIEFFHQTYRKGQSNGLSIRFMRMWVALYLADTS